MFQVLFFDFFILGGIVLSFWLTGYFLHHHSCKSKKPYPCWLLAVIVLIPGLILIYGSFIESRMLVVREYDYSFPAEKALKSPKKVVLISDIHVGPYKKRDFSTRVVNKIAEIEPDLILMAGDYFLGDHANEARYHFEPYGELPLIAPTVAVLGNHAFRVGIPGKHIPDYEEADDVRTVLQDLGILGLEDAVAKFFDEDPLYIVGAQDIWSEADDFDSIELPDRSARTIVISHNPDLILDAQDKVDMVVSGHTHGGQIRLPGIGPLAKPGPTQLPRDTFKGASKFGETTLYVTAGLGESGPRARLFNPPEIVLMTLH